MQHATNLLASARDGISQWDAKPFLQKVTDVVPSVIYIYNHRTRSNEYSNRSLGDALGFSVFEIKQMGTKVVTRLCHPDDIPKIATHFAHIATLDDGEVAEIEYRARHKDGHWIWLLSRDAVFQRGPDNKVLRHIGVAADITALKQAEERATAEKLKSRTVNEELQSFCYAMSHDLKSPSNTLELLLQELLESHSAALPDDARGLAEMGLTTARHMSALVADVLDYTALVGVHADLLDVTLNTVFANVLHDLRHRIRETGAQVSIGKLPVVRGDPGQLHLMFRNLIDNAIRFQQPGIRPQVAVRCAPATDSGKVAITVSDKGIGIDPRDHEKIFSVFRRLNPNHPDAGSGLGLSICRRIAATHGDRMTVASRSGAGAAFTVRLTLS